METKIIDAEVDVKARFERSQERARIATEKFIASLPKSGNADMDEIVSEIATKAYRIGRNEMCIEVMSAL